MEENNTKVENRIINFKKKRTIFLACGFIFILLVTIFLLFFKEELFKKDVDENNTIKEEEKADSENNEEIEVLLKKLPYYYGYEGGNSEMNTKLYIDKLVTLDELNQPGFLAKVVGHDYYEYENKIPSSIKEEKEAYFYSLTEEEKGEIAKKIRGFDDSLDYYEIRSIDEIKYIIKEKYNFDNYDINNYGNEFTKTNNNISFWISGGMAYLYGDYIYLYYGMGGAGGEKVTLSYDYDKTDEEIDIYEKIIIIDGTSMYSSLNDIGNSDLFDIDKNRIVSGTCKTNQLGNKYVKEFNVDYKKSLQLDTREKQIKYIEDECGKYALTYKHVFKLNSSREYYWYSTEPYKA